MAMQGLSLRPQNDLNLPPTNSFRPGINSKYQIRTPDALLIATSISEKADVFITNDGRLRPLKAEGLAILVLDDFLR